MNNQNSIPTATASSASSLRSKLRRNLILAAVFLALLAPVTVKFLSDKPQARAHTPTAPRVDWSAKVEKIRTDLSRVNDEAVGAESKVWESFGKRLKEIQKQDRKDTQSSVKSAVNSLVQVDQIGWLIADFAQDKVLGGDRAGSRVKACSNSFIQTLKDSALRSTELLDSLKQELTAVNNRYAMQVGEIIETQGSQLPPANFEQLAALHRNVAMEVTAEVGGAAIAVVLEAAAIGATRESMTKLLGLMGKKLAPQISKATIGVGAAVGDGPLPVGDILAVGLAVWTVWDVVSLPNRIRSDVRKEFSQAAERHLELLDDQVTSAIRELSAQPRQARENLQQEVLARLP